MYDWSQKADVLNALKSGKSLTQKQAINEFGIGRLAPIIHYLRNQLGYDIESKIITVPGRHGKMSHVAEYTLRSDGNG